MIPTGSNLEHQLQQPPINSYNISFLALHKSGSSVNVKFTFCQGQHNALAVANILKTKCLLLGEPKEIAKKIQLKVDAQRSGQAPSQQTEDDNIAIQDDAFYLIARDICQEVLLKDQRKYAKQRIELNKSTVEQLTAIMEENSRHEKELERIENASKEAGRTRELRLERKNKEDEEQQQKQEAEEGATAVQEETKSPSAPVSTSTSAVAANVLVPTGDDLPKTSATIVPRLEVDEEIIKSISRRPSSTGL